MDLKDKLKLKYGNEKNKQPITEVESFLLDSIDIWIEKEMKYFTDAQYGKGKFKAIAQQAKEMIAKRMPS